MVKTLLSEDAKAMMRALMDNKQILDEDTALCINDCLNNRIRNGDQYIALPADNTVIE